MSKEQQIKELAEKLKQCGYPDAEADPKVIASRVINSGYRKQSDVAREFAEKAIENIEKMDNPEYWDEARLGFESGREHSVSKIEALAKEFGVEE